MKTGMTLLFLSLFFATLPSLAQDSTSKKSPFKFLIAGALEFGGDDVAEVYFTNGNTQKVRAGQGGTIAVGVQFQIPTVEKLLLRSTIGYKYVTTEADNAHIRLTRVPIQFTANWMAAKKLRLGAGLLMHKGIKFNADGIGNDLKFHPATGAIFEIAYAGIGLSYTAMQYKDFDSNNYSANAIGVTFSLTLPNK